MDFAASVSSWAAPVCWEVNVANGEADAFPNQLFLLLCGSLGGEGAYIALSHEHVHRHCYKPSNYKSEPCVYLKDEVSIYKRLLLLGNILGTENRYLSAVLPRWVALLTVNLCLSGPTRSSLRPDLVQSLKCYE